jgi:hypothetical protein
LQHLGSRSGWLQTIPSPCCFSRWVSSSDHHHIVIVIVVISIISSMVDTWSYHQQVIDYPPSLKTLRASPSLGLWPSELLSGRWRWWCLGWKSHERRTHVSNDTNHTNESPMKQYTLCSLFTWQSGKSPELNGGLPGKNPALKPGFPSVFVIGKSHQITIFHRIFMDFPWFSSHVWLPKMGPPSFSQKPPAAWTSWLCRTSRIRHLTLQGDVGVYWEQLVRFNGMFMRFNGI